jgi:DNA invertase Pin-like site-specific DNA recombinase
MRIGYARVSKAEQNSQLQLDALQIAGCERIFVDEGISGEKEHRKGLDDALAALRPGDSLVIWKLDRLGRSLRNLLNLIHDLKARNIHFVCTTQGLDTSTPLGELMLQIVGAFAQYELTMIRERTRAGLAVARSEGKQIGRKQLLSPEAIAEAYRLVTIERRSVPDVAKELKVCDDTLTRSFRRYGLAA